jgi:hypothetical protein
MSTTLQPRIARPLAALNGPAVQAQEVVADAGLYRVLRAIDRGMPVYDASDGYLIQWPVFEVYDDGRLDPQLILGELA